MTSNIKHILWFDDEWNTAREAGLGPWKRELDDLIKTQPFKLTICSCVKEFSTLLQQHQGNQFSSSHDKPIFNLLIIDVMLANEHEQNYECLGFENEMIFRLDAGAQIAGLIRSSIHDGVRPVWLDAYRKIPMMILSSSPTLRACYELIP